MSARNGGRVPGLYRAGRGKRAVMAEIALAMLELTEQYVAAMRPIRRWSKINVAQSLRACTDRSSIVFPRRFTASLKQ